jgi:Dullard-like phosphatase family protein
MSSIQFKSTPKNNPEVIGRIHVNQSNNFNGIQVNTKKRGISVTNPKNQITSQKKTTLKSNNTNNTNKLISNVITQVQPKTITSKQISDQKNQTKSHSYSPNRLLNSQMKINGLLPPKISDKKTLVLDLDETLVHSGFLPFSCPSDVVIKIELENEIHDIHVLVRPGVKEFLEKMSKKYEIVIFTASLAKYADPLLDIIDKQGYCPFRLFREHCTLINTAFVKDLKRLGRELKDIIIVDNSPISYALNPDNGLPILSWFEDKNDRELFNITPILEFLSEVNDVRDYIKKIVVNNEINFTKAMNVINQFNNNKKKINENNELLNSIKNGNNKNIKNIIQTVENKNVENPQEINIKIINNNITNFICNNNNNKEEEEKNKTGFSYINSNTLYKNKFTLIDKIKKNNNNNFNNNSLK